MRNKIIIILVLIAAVILRFSVIFLAHHGDLNNNISWATVSYEKGLNGFYEGKGLPLNDRGQPDWPYSAPNQPPLTILLFSFSRMVWQNIRNFIWYMNWELLIFPSKLVWFWDDHGMDLLIKLPSVVADVGIGCVIYKFFEKRKEFKTGLILLFVWLFNPITWYNSSLWGQTDSIVNLLGLIAILALIDKRLIAFAGFFTASLFFKSSLSIFVPVLLFLAIKQKHNFKKWVWASFTGLAVLILSSLWFHPQFDLFVWLIKLYKDRILSGEIGTITANAFNFWWLVNSFTIPIKTTKFGMLDNIPYYGWNFLGIYARAWGFIITLSGIALLIVWLSKKVTNRKIFITLLLTALISFLFMTRMHERYLYPFFPVSTIFLGLTPGYWPVYAVLSFTYLINMYNLFWAPSIPFLELFIKNNVWFPNLLSLVNVIMLFVSLRLLKSAKL